MQQPITIAVETPCGPEIVALIEEAEALAALLYPAESRHGLSVEALAEQGVRFIVARLASCLRHSSGVAVKFAGQAVGCCGFLPNADGTAELKRLFVTERARGHGIAAKLLREVEAAARAEGVMVMRLETGIRAEAAQALYRRFGYRERGPFGHYRPDPLSVFMERSLA